MTKLYLRNNKMSIKERWIPIVWYCVECDKLSDRIRKVNLKSVYQSKNIVKLYRRSNRKNEKSWISEYYYNVNEDKILNRV